MNKSSLYTVGGTIPPGKIYIQRQADEELLALCRAGTLAYVLSTRQVGKSSLMVRTAQKLEAEGTRCALVDLSLLGTQFEDAEWYLGLLSEIDDCLQLTTDFEGWWERYAHLSESQRLVNFFKKVVVEEVRTPIVIFLDEIDSTLTLPVTSDFFAAIRALYNARALVPALKRLTFVLIGVATPSDLINDSKRTPFNIGQRVELTDFTLNEATPLGKGFGLPADKAQQLLACSLKWTGGHPYLTQRLCVALLQELKEVSLLREAGLHYHSEVLKVVERSFFGEKSQQDHNLQFVRGMLTERAPDKLRVLSTYRDIRLGGIVHNDPQSVIQNHLKLSGIVCREGNKLRIRNPIYEEVFNWQWIKEQWPVNHELYTIGGTISPGKLYIQRQADEELLDLCRTGTFAYVLAARHVGKSSLMVQIAQKLAAEGMRCALVDLSILRISFFSPSWYLELLQMINDSLGLMSDTESWWVQQGHLSGSERMVHFFKEVVALSQAPIVIFLDEIDCTLKKPLRNLCADFFAAIRALYNARTQMPALQRLTFVLMGVAAPCELINDPKCPLFNIGQCVELTDFTPDEAISLLQGLSLPADKTQLMLACVLKWTGGHPYLTQRLCVALLGEPKQFERGRREAEAALHYHSEVDRVVARTFFGSKSEEDKHLRFVRDMLTKRAHDRASSEMEIALLSTYRNIREGRTVRHDPQSLIQSHLKLSGIVCREGNKLRVRNPIYEEVFDQQWIKEQWPLNWWQTLPRSVKIASVMLAVMFVMLLFSLFFAINQQQQAKQQARQAFQARAEAENQTSLVQSQAKASEALLELSHNNLDRSLLLTRASLSYTTNYPILVSRALQQIEEDTKWLRQVLLHSDRVKSAAWSPDGLRVLTNSSDGIARIWDATTGQLLLSLEEFNPHKSATWSSDGQRVLTMGDDGKVRIWSREGQLLQSLVESEDSFSVVKWSPDGQEVLTGSYDGGRLQIWSREGQLLQSFIGHSGAVWSAAFSPDGQEVLTDNSDSRVRIWSREGQLLQSFVDPERVDSVRWSPDGTVVLTCNDEGFVRIWSREGQQLHTLAEAFDCSRSVALVGQKVAISGPDKAQIWQIDTGQLLTTLLEQRGPVSSMAWSPDGLRLLTGDWDGTVRIWSREGQLLRSFSAHSSPVNQVAWHPDGLRLLTSSSDQKVRIWDATENSKNISRVVSSPNGQQVLIMSQDGSTQIWQATTRQLLSTLPVSSDEISQVEWSPNGQQVLTISQDGSTYHALRVQIWQAATGQLLSTLPAHSDSIQQVVWSPNGLQVLTESQDGIQIWQAATGELLRTLSADRILILGQGLYTLDFSLNGYVDVAWSPNGQQLLTNSGQIWDTTTGQLLHTLKHREILSMAWSPDGQELCTSNWDGQAQIWDATTGQLLRTLEEHSSSNTWEVAWSPDGQRILTVSHEKLVRKSSVQIWNATTGQLLRSFKGHSAPIWEVAWSPNGQKVLTGSEDNTARIWNATTGDLLSILEGHSDDISSVKWIADGQQVLTSSRDGSERIWIVDESLLMARLTEVVCMVWAHDEEAISEEIRNWGGCEVELADVADILEKYKALRGRK